MQEALAVLCCLVILSSCHIAVQMRWQLHSSDRSAALHDTMSIPPTPRVFLARASKLVATASRAVSVEDRLCNAYSRQYIHRWAGQHQDLCQQAGLQPPSSRVLCSIHPDVDLTTCLVKNLWFSSSRFLGVAARVNGLPEPAPGSLAVDCQLATVAGVLRGRLLHEGMTLYFNQTLQYSSDKTTCEMPHGNQHDMVLLIRRDPVNPFHVLEQLVSLFGGLSALQRITGEEQMPAQVLVLDDHPEGPYWPILDRMSATGRARQLRKQPLPDGACLRRAVLAPWVGDLQSLLTQHSGIAVAIPCPSEVLVATSMWLRWLFRDLHAKPPTPGTASAAAADPAATDTPAGAGQPQVLKVLWLSRARQEAALGQRMSQWQQVRVLANEAAVVASINATVIHWNQQPLCPRLVWRGAHDGCRPPVLYELKVVELSSVPFYPDQLALLFSAGVLAGVHGAALTNQVWLPPASGAVVELWHGMADNYHYQNMAAMLMHGAYVVRTPEVEPGLFAKSANATAVAEALRQAMVDVAGRRQRRGRRRHKRGSMFGI